MRGNDRNNGFLYCLPYLCRKYIDMKKEYPSWDTIQGRPKKIESPKRLWELAIEYFNQVDNNPWIRKEVVKGGWLAGQVFDVKTQCPYTWDGLQTYIYMNAGLVRLDDYRTNKEDRYADFAVVVHAIERAIYDQKITGATVGAFQHNIIAMELGLSTKVHNTTVTEQPLFPAPPDKEDEK